MLKLSAILLLIVFWLAISMSASVGLAMADSLPVVSTEDNAPPFVVSGVLMNSGSIALINHFVDYISLESGYKLQPVYVDTYAELSEIVANTPGAIAWTCGAPFVQDHLSDGQQLVSIPLFHNKPEYHSLVITRIDRTEKALVDFKGGILAYSDIRSNSGYVSPAISLFNQGIDIQNHFRLTLRAGNHERSIQAVENRLADVAAIDEYIWVEYSKNTPAILKKIKVIEKSGPYPFTPIVANKLVSAEVISALQRVLTDLNTSIKGKKFLSEFGFDGFVNKEVEYFEPIKLMLDQLKRDMD